MMNRVGRPAMFDGKGLFAETGTPDSKSARSRTWLAVWLPDPLTLATLTLNSFTTAGAVCPDTVRAAGSGVLMRARPREARRSPATRAPYQH